MIRHRTKVVGVMIVLFVLQFLFFQAVFAYETTRYDVYDHERAVRVALMTGEQFMCVPTGEGFGFTGDHENWVAFTCLQVKVADAKWQFCRGAAGQPIFECVPPGTKIKGAEAAEPVKPGIRLQVQ